MTDSNVDPHFKNGARHWQRSHVYSTSKKSTFKLNSHPDGSKTKKRILNPDQPHFHICLLYYSMAVTLPECKPFLPHVTMLKGDNPKKDDEYTVAAIRKQDRTGSVPLQPQALSVLPKT